MNIDRVFLDSGGHSLRTCLGKSLPSNFLETDALWEYVDNYCQYIIKNNHLIETYVNVDIIYNPELTWKIQKYMEDTWKLNPLPVYHITEDWKWMLKYLDNYDYIGTSGLSRAITKSQWIKLIGDPLFSLICKAPTYLPSHKIHVFAMTSASIIAAYPFYSVDSTSWIQFGKFGMIIVPKRKHDKFIYTVSPHTPYISSRPEKQSGFRHLENFSSINSKYITDYFTEKGFVLGKSEFKTVNPKVYTLGENEVWASNRSEENSGLVETVIEKGLCNSHEIRDNLNLQFFLDFEASTPTYPWPWKKHAKATRLFEID